MKIIIPTTNNSELNSIISDHFGKASFMTKVETDTGEVFSFESRGRHSGGSQHPAAIACDLAADVVLCSNLGYKAIQYFRDRGVEVYTGAAGTVREILAAFHEGKLQKADETSACRGGDH